MPSANNSRRHTDAEKSTGIRKPTKTTADEQAAWPEVVKKAIADNMADYEWLRERRLQL